MNEIDAILAEWSEKALLRKAILGIVSDRLIVELKGRDRDERVATIRKAIKEAWEKAGVADKKSVRVDPDGTIHLSARGRF